MDNNDQKSLKQIIEYRIQKINQLRSEGIEPYPYKFKKDYDISYVLNSEKELMNKNILNWEPNLALFVEDDNPLLFYKEIAKKSSNVLRKNGLLYFEINENFGKETIKLLEEIGFVNIELKKDINGKDRMVKAMCK